MLKQIQKKRTLLALAGIFVIISFVYFKNYQGTLNRLTDIFNERCDVLQPILDKKIELAKKYSDSYDSSESSDIQVKYIVDILKLGQQTIDFSTPWLARANKSINTPNYQFFIDQSIKDKTNALLDKFEADLLANQAMVVYFTHPNKETASYLKFAVKNMDDKQIILDEKVKAASNYSDIRGYLLRLHKPKCNFFQKNFPEIPAINTDITG